MVCLSSRDSQNVVPGPAASAWSLLEIQILRPHQDPLNQKLWRWGQAVCGLTSPPGSSEAVKVLEPLI